jgi:hypothetical protein
VSDPYSWHVLLGDLVRAVLLGPEVVTAGGASFAAWSRHVEALTLASLDDHVRFWRAELPPAVPACPVDLDGAAPNDLGGRSDLTVDFDEATTGRLLRDDRRAGAGAAVEARLAGALARAYAAWAGAPGLLLLVQSSGRDLAPPGADLSRTVGWFTCTAPVWLEVGDEPPAATVRRAGDGLGRVLARKHTWDLLRHGPSAPLAGLPEPAVVLDYLGQLDRADATVPAGAGVRPLSGAGRPRLEPAPPDPTMRRTGLIGVEAAVRAGTLRATFHYSRHHHRQTTMAALADGFRDQVLAGTGGPTRTTTKGASGVRPR